VVVVPDTPFWTVDSVELAVDAVFARVIRIVPWSPGRRMAGVTWYEVMVTVGSPFAAPAARGMAERRRASPTPRISILFIVLASGLLGFWQEYRATNAVQRLVALVQVKATVLRDYRPQEIPIEEVVPGDIVALKAGDVIPGDCLMLESRDLFVDEAVLTGETYPVEKQPGY
jgi:cation transport ATPase